MSERTRPCKILNKISVRFTNFEPKTLIFNAVDSNSSLFKYSSKLKNVQPILLFQYELKDAHYYQILKFNTISISFEVLKDISLIQ
jgi:hypothetical protein